MAEMPARLKIPPQSIDAEQAVLGSMIADRDRIAVVMDILTPDSFYKENHAIIYEAILDLFNRNEPVDMVTLTEFLERKNTLDKIGGPAYLASLTEALSTPKHAEKYARMVDEKNMLRRLINAANQISESAYSHEGETMELLAWSEKLVFDVGQGRDRRELKPMKDAVRSAYKGIETAYKNRGRPIGMSSGFRNIDSITGGFKPTELIVLAARPGVGKTSLAMNFASNMALSNQKVPVGIFSLEMGEEQLAKRLISAVAKVDAFALDRGQLVDSDWPKIAEAFDKLYDSPIYIVDSPGISPVEIRAKTLRMVREFDVKFIIVDYLQLMSTASIGRSLDNRNAEISEMTRQLKLMALELKIPVLILSQLSRETEKQSGSKKPKLSHLRDSGSIEQDADIVMFVYREAYYNTEDEEQPENEPAEVIVAKNRNGPTGIAKLMFSRPLTRFDDRAPDYHE